MLYDDADVGRDKVERAAARLEATSALGADRSKRGAVACCPTMPRFTTLNGIDLVIEGADNFATKFLAVDACLRAGVPVVQAGAVRWSGWALATLPGQSACLRCVFEDIPRDRVETCAGAGVVGAVVGVLGALQAALAIRLLLGDDSAAGELWSLRGLDGVLRASRVRQRAGCPGCDGTTHDLGAERYAPRVSL